MPRSEKPISVTALGNTRGASNQARGGVAACVGFGAGPERIHRLDLNEFAERVRVRVVVDADFDALVTLEQGPCEDSAPYLCDRASAAGRAASTWAIELEPGEYQVVVDGARSEDFGAYRLTAWVEPLGASCEAPPHSTCDAATPIPTDLSVATVLVAEHCERVAGSERPELYYRLDLENETEVVGVHASLRPADSSIQPSAADGDLHPHFTILGLDDDSECGSIVTEYGLYGAHANTASAALAPGSYLLALDQPPQFPALLSVRLTRPDCAGNQHDRCEDAEDIVLEDGFARLRGHTFCNTNQLSHDDCSADTATPDRFYRLDLSERSERAHLRATLPPRDLDFFAALVLLREEDGGCGAALQCYDSIADGEGWPEIDAMLEPGVYLIAVEAMVAGSAGNYVLEVEVSEPREEFFRPCYSGDIDACVFFPNYASSGCCSNPLAPNCGTQFVSCGLDPRVQDCICRADERCCNGTEEDFERCAGVFAECGFFCDHEPASLFACVDLEILRQ